MKIILASKSPRRETILSRLNHPFEIIDPNLDESILSTSIIPTEYCKILAKFKAQKVGKQYPEALTIGSDTIVVIKNNILNKPKDKLDAQKMLKMLCGHTHLVITGVCLYFKQKNISYCFSETTKVTFRKINKQEILHYIKYFKPYDKSGAYGIQDWSAIFVKKIDGCYDNVVGFPLSRFYYELKKNGINLLDSF